MARGFGIGDFAKAFNTTYDTVNKVAQDFEVAKIANEKPIDSFGLSTDQNEQVFQSLADGGTARDVQNDDGSFGGVAVSKSMAEGFEGPAQAKTLAPQKITTYLGREFVGGLDPAKATSARNRALAGVITKSDPIQGMKLDALLTQDERADQEYSEKEQLRALRKKFVDTTNPFDRADLGRQIASLTGGGEFIKGFGDFEKANLNALVSHTRGFLARGDVKGAMNVYNQYDNGEDGEVVEMPGGGYQLNFYQGKPGGDNKPTSSRVFKGLDDINTWFNDQFDPEAAVKRKAEQAASELKFGREVQKAMLIKQAETQMRQSTLKPNHRWEIDPDTGEPTGVQVEIGAAGGTRSSGGKGKAPTTPAEQLDDIIKSTIGGVNGQNNPLTLDQSSLYKTAAHDALKLNPNISPALANQAGLAFAQNPQAASQVWNPQLGLFVEQMQMPQGFVAVNKVTHRNAAARNIPPEKLKQAVESSIASLSRGDPTKRQAVILAATDSKARRALVDDIALKQLSADPRFKTLTPKAQADRLTQAQQIVERQLAVPLGWIINYGHLTK